MNYTGNTELLHQIALTLVAGVGCITAKQLIAYCGSAKTVFDSSTQALMRIPDIGTTLAHAIAQHKKEVLDRAAQELVFAEKNGVEPLFFLDKRYPERLRNCDDSPLVLYVKGAVDFNVGKVLSIVGTRSATQYGRQLCDNLVRDLVELGYRPLIVSGLAFGIDVCAHRAALKYGLPTAAVLGHGLDTLYPQQHSAVAAEMLQHSGALLSDFTSRCTMDPSNFVRRNRIMAGMADATIVVESPEKGGALITADMAFDYSREVLAFPARIGDKASEGCLKLIRVNKASLIRNAADVAYTLGWDVQQEPRTTQLPLFPNDLEGIEKKIFDMLSAAAEPQSIDMICRVTGIAMSQASAALLSLEFEGWVKALPGKVFMCNTK